MFENFGSGHGLESAIGEQQLKRTQSVSSSRSGRDREQQLKRMQAASSRRNRGAQQQHAEAKGEQQLKWMPQSGPGVAAEADTSGEQQLKRTQSGSNSACSVHRELHVQRRITHGRRARRK